MLRHMRVIAALSFLPMLGAGCLSVSSTKVAQPFESVPSKQDIAHTSGFGTLPKAYVPDSSLRVELEQPVPETPKNVTVLRLKNGTPNETEIQNIAGAIGVSPDILGREPVATQLSVEWIDPNGYRWSYDAKTRTYTFDLIKKPERPLTLATMPEMETVIRTANDFLTTHGVKPNYRDPVLEPSWATWADYASKGERCVDASVLAAIRHISTSPVLLKNTPPELPLRAETNCVSPEFPSAHYVRYHAFIDGQDVVSSNGQAVSGAEIFVDTVHNLALSGSFTLFANADRSDYPARTKAQIEQALYAGGLSGSRGSITVTSYDVMLYRLEDTEHEPEQTYLIPALVAMGTRLRPDNQTEPFKLVVPLVGP